jgi:hypothetical protein
VKGYSEETRAAAFQALTQHATKQAMDALEKAADDPVFRSVTGR